MAIHSQEPRQRILERILERIVMTLPSHRSMRWQSNVANVAARDVTRRHRRRRRRHRHRHGNCATATTSTTSPTLERQLLVDPDAGLTRPHRVVATASRIATRGTVGGLFVICYLFVGLLIRGGPSRSSSWIDVVVSKHCWNNSPFFLTVIL